ncbi:hypothetical protein HPB48_023406 [Haemaphysalis longicornis]|uniref:Uncharacterized protein n=1 Tax=Haemaphysalis longicornis TaxID=44386 RepID=A0A9J6H668_HAELO|nr:hypothetical protein HPB48_023406 [Haemaphysalis longicornis]
MAILRAVQERSHKYSQRSTNVLGTAASLTSDNSSLGELIKSVLRKELGKLGIATPQPNPSMARIEREELHQAFSPPDPSVQESPASYTAAMRQQRPNLPTVPLRQPPPLVQSWPTSQPEFPPTRVRKRDLMRAGDWKPLCYHCGSPTVI